MSLIGTSAIETIGSTLFLLPMVSESIFCLRRSRRCFRAFLFVVSNVARSRVAGIPGAKTTPKVIMMMFTTIVGAMEMFRVEKGMVLIIMVGEALGGEG